MNSVQKLFLKTVLILLALVILIGQAQAQPPVCISQEAANKCVTAAGELIEARKVIEAFQKERAASVAEREAAQMLIKGLNDLIAVKDRIDKEKDAAFEFAQKVIKFQQDLIADLEKRLSKPKSAWSRFVDILKNAAILLAGIQLGRGI